MRVLVCGGRAYSDREKLFKTLNDIHNSKKGIDIIICGAAKGADTLAIHWAMKNEVIIHAYPAQWSRLGNAAGPSVRLQMLQTERPDRVLVFPGGEGTEDMRAKATMYGYDVKVIK